VGVEKLDLSKTVKKTLRLDALQTMISVLVDIFYPPKFGCFEENGLFQHPRLLTTVTLFPGVEYVFEWTMPPETSSPQSAALNAMPRLMKG